MLLLLTLYYRRVHGEIKHNTQEWHPI